MQARRSVPLVMVLALASFTPAPANPASGLCAERGYPHEDVFPSHGIAVGEFSPPGPGWRVPFALRFDQGEGTTVICRGDARDGHIPLEMVRLELTGHHSLFGAFRLDVRRDIPSVGGIDLGPDGLFRDSFFDVFVSLRFEGGSVDPLDGASATNCLDPSQPGTPFCVPFRVEADLTGVTSLPPVHGPVYAHPFGQEVPLWVDPDPGNPEDEFITGRLVGGCHKPGRDEQGVEHAVCVVAFGDNARDASGDTCMRSPSRLVALDMSRPAHRLAAVTAEPSGPLTVTPWLPSSFAGEDAMVALSRADSAGCADVGVRATAVFDDLDSTTVEAAWRQLG